jgi:short-subunit dehydrogenase
MKPTVLITGASQGIGKATALLFARNGYNLVLAARQPDRLTALAQELEAANHTVLAVPTDVKDSAQVTTLVQAAINRFSTINVLVNNAGIYFSGPVEYFSLEEWHQAIDTNLWGYIHTIHALLPHLIAQQSGTIVNVCSIGGKVPIPYLVPYVTSKFAIAGLTQALHAELQPKGVHVSGIYPNVIKSDLMERAVFQGESERDRAARREQLEQVLKLPLLEKSEDVAKAIWQAVESRKAEVVVGSAHLSEIAYKFTPNLTQRLFRRVFKQAS